MLIREVCQYYTVNKMPVMPHGVNMGNIVIFSNCPGAEGCMCMCLHGHGHLGFRAISLKHHTQIHLKSGEALLDFGWPSWISRSLRSKWSSVIPAFCRAFAAAECI